MRVEINRLVQIVPLFNAHINSYNMCPADYDAAIVVEPVLDGTCIRLDDESGVVFGRVLILADEIGKGFSTILGSMMKGRYAVESLIKTNALTSQVLNGVEQLTANFDRKDHVIIIAGSTDVLRGKKFNQRQMRSVLSRLTHTNIILVTVPFAGKNYQHDERIYKYNLSSWIMTECRTRDGPARNNIDIHISDRKFFRDDEESCAERSCERAMC